MKLGVIGFGQAGGKVTERLVEYDSQNNSGIVVDAVAINSAKADLLGLELIPDSNRVLIGQSDVKGHGVGADNDLGAEIAKKDMNEIMGSIDDFPVHKMDAFLIVAGLGGGTGSGGAPVLANQIQTMYDEPVYGLGVLPAEQEGGIYSRNAARSLQTFVDSVENLMLFDNDSWRESGESVGEGYKRMNDELITRLGVLFGAGEIDPNQNVGELVVDSSEIINTLGSKGLSTVGYSSTEIDYKKKNKGFLSSLGFGGTSETEDMDENVQASNRITSLARKAVMGRLTHPADVSSTERALIVVAGPPDYISRKGVEDARRWIEQETECMEVRGGDYPIEGTDRLAVVVLLSGVTNSRRIKELQRIGVEAQENMDELRSESGDKLDDLIQDDDDELESLF